NPQSLKLTIFISTDLLRYVEKCYEYARADAEHPKCDRMRQDSTRIIVILSMREVSESQQEDFIFCDVFKYFFRNLENAGV
ncbi:MAG TPA: hypothetical protein V6D30_02435, partial [Leptolyngbyaceae cyanobacterium]